MAKKIQISLKRTHTYIETVTKTKKCVVRDHVAAAATFVTVTNTAELVKYVSYLLIFQQKYKKKKKNRLRKNLKSIIVAFEGI